MEKGLGIISRQEAGDKTPVSPQEDGGFSSKRQEVFYCFFETGSHNVSPGLNSLCSSNSLTSSTVLLPRPSECCDYKLAPSHLATGGFCAMRIVVFRDLKEAPVGDPGCGGTKGAG